MIHHGDLTGRRIGRWTILGHAPSRKASHYAWHCRCNCGREKNVLSTNLRRGLSLGCGCHRGQANVTHGHTRSGTRPPTYRAWEAMKRRVLVPSSADYPRYGGRGITICPAWRVSYEAFLTDMGECPPGRMLDRIDNNGPYDPANCRWADRATQNGNKRSNNWVLLDGKRMLAAEAARRLGITQLNAARMQARIDRLVARRRTA